MKYRSMRRAGVSLLLAAALSPGAGLAQEACPESAKAPIRLTDVSGAQFDSAEAMEGRPYIVYFGYTFCPDVCPMTLASISAALYELESRGVSTGDLGFLFVTLDPSRDTAEYLSEYVTAFHPRLTALIGTEEEIVATAQSWDITFSRTETDDPEVYFVDHPAYAFLLDQNHCVSHKIWHIQSPDKTIEQIQSALNSDETQDH